MTLNQLHQKAKKENGEVIYKFSTCIRHKIVNVYTIQYNKKESQKYVFNLKDELIPYTFDEQDELIYLQSEQNEQSEPKCVNL